MPRCALLIAADHPAYAGHFPGQPILPGVVLLDAAQRAIESAQQVTLTGLAVAKFHQTVAPGAPLTLDYACTDRAVTFDILGSAGKVASGQFTLNRGA